MPVIMMSGHGTIDTAVATKFGAQSFLEKPITMQKLLRAVEQGLAKFRSARSQSQHRPCTHGHGHPITAAQSYNNLSASNMVASRPEVQSAPHGAITFGAVTSLVSAHNHHQQGLRTNKAELDRPLREAAMISSAPCFEFHLAREAAAA